jgi:formamidopyrimidine-DNA glycosylase
MPEGPEVQIMVDGLNDLIKGKQLVKMEVLGGRYQNQPISGLTHGFSTGDHPVEGVRRHGKAILIDLHTRNTIVVTLGMTGKFSLDRQKHAAIQFDYRDEEEIKSFYFVDQRRFGTVRIIANANLYKILPKVGWDPLKDPVQLDYVAEALEDNTRPIGQVLMDAGVFSGVGNYLRAEILYASRISPWRPCEKLTSKELVELCSNARRICLRSYELGGNTIENFSSLNGGTGKFFEEIKVYGKKTDPEGNPVVSEKTPEGRTIHWVPNVQF